MRWIAGIYNLDGRAVDPALLQQLLSPVCAGSAGKCRWWVDGPIGIATHTRNPLSDESGHAFSLAAADDRIAIGFDGRIDNKRELQERLHRRQDLNGQSDSELVAAAYEEWGIECLDRVLGDFAFSQQVEKPENRDLLEARIRLLCEGDGVAPAAAGTALEALTATWALFLTRRAALRIVPLVHHVSLHA